MIPRWFLAIWDVLILATVAIGIATLRLHPAVIAFLAGGGGMLASMRLIIWMYSNPKWNSVELKVDSLHIFMGHPLFVWREEWRRVAEIPYSNLERIHENARHSFWPVWIWPYKPLSPHVDLELKRRQAIRRFGRFKTIHLDVADPLRFIAELRLAARAWAHL
jgi:hypothetical protein